MSQLRHYFTLSQIVQELRKQLQHSQCIDCFTQEKNVLMMVFLADNSQQESEEIVLECSFDMQMGGLFVRKNFHRARKNTRDCFGKILGQSLTDIRIQNNERTIILEFGEMQLLCSFFGAGHGNALLLNPQSVILEAFKDNREFHGKSFQLEDTGARLLPITEIEDDRTTIKALAGAEYLLGKHYAQEVLTRAGISPTLKITQLSLEQKKTLHETALNIRREALESETYYLQRDSNNLAYLTTLPCSSLELPEKQFSSILEATVVCIATIKREKRFNTGFQQYSKEVLRQKKKFGKALQHITSDTKSGERASARQHWGELLLSQPRVQEKVGSEMTVTDWDGSAVTIPLNDRLTVYENAEQFFTKARNAKQSAIVQAKRQEEYEEKVLRLEEAEEALLECKQADNPLRALDTFSQQFADIIGAMNTKSAGKTQATQFREFDLGEGYMLYVGKDSRNNDELTMRFAKPNDYWFHARGVSGSHAVLRGEDSKAKPPKYILEKSASIAAYYSKSRNASMTPVAYTQKKNVRKRKGMAAGAVLLEREKVIMVRPELPSGDSE
jgi:predicted ribosome quality control (RQC) complex YloA/Tae2 family protein